MKVNVLPIVAGFAGSLILSAAASAGFTGLKLENMSSTYLSADPGTFDGQGFNQYNAAVFELYANFDNAGDNLLNVFGAQINGSKNFYHIGADTDEQQSLPFKKSVYDAAGMVDSFVTIGFQYGGTNANPNTGNPGQPDGPDAGTGGDPIKVSLDPSFDEVQFLFGSSIDDPANDPTKGAGWFGNPADANNIQGVAGNYADGKVLIGRFSFAGDADFNTSELVSILGKLRITYKSGTTGQTVQTDFLSFAGERVIPAVPAPGAIALLGLAGLAGRRRRSA
jgi:MYXO-CTERM domain-containing protein